MNETARLIAQISSQLLVTQIAQIKIWEADQVDLNRLEKSVTTWHKISLLALSNSADPKTEVASMAKKKTEKVDGLGPDDLKRIHKALGQVRRWSYPVNLAKKRALRSDGFYQCENKKCPNRGNPVPSVQVDHIIPIGEIGSPGYIQKMFVPSSQLQCLCKLCHAVKTKAEGARRRSKKKQSEPDDFF